MKINHFLEWYDARNGRANILAPLLSYTAQAKPHTVRPAPFEPKRCHHEFRLPHSHNCTILTMTSQKSRSDKVAQWRFRLSVQSPDWRRDGSTASAFRSHMNVM